MAERQTPGRAPGRRRRAAGWLGTVACALLALWSQASAKSDALPLAMQGRHARLQAARDARTDRSAASVITLWLLAHDSDAEVVGGALEAALARCHTEPHAVCLATLGFFMEGEAQWPGTPFGRAQLLTDDLGLAQLLARRDTKLEVVSLLAGRLGQGTEPQPWLAALGVLAADSEPEVQEAASAVLSELENAPL